MKSQTNMMWHNVPHHHIAFFCFFFFGTWNHELQICHAMTNLHVKFYFIIFSPILWTKMLGHHLNMMMYMCMYSPLCIYACKLYLYIIACIHQRLNPFLHGNTLMFWPPNHFKILKIIMKKNYFIMFGMKLFRKFKL